MEMPFLMRLAIRRPLMKSHGIRKLRLKQIVIANGNAPQNVRKKLRFSARQVRKRTKMSLAQNQQLKRPDRPKRHYDRKSVVRADYALPAPELQSKIVAKQARFSTLHIFLKRCQLPRRNIRQ